MKRTILWRKVAQSAQATMKSSTSATGDHCMVRKWAGPYVTAAISAECTGVLYHRGRPRRCI